MCDSLCPFEITDMLQQNNNNNYLCLERGCHNRKITVENSGDCGGGGGGGGDNLPQATSQAERRGEQRQGPKTKGFRSRTVSGACAKNKKKAKLTKPGLQPLSQPLGGITACQTRLVSDSPVSDTISCLNTGRFYSSRSENSCDGPGIRADVSALSLSSISSLGSPVTVATLEASEVNQTVAPTTVEGSFLSTTARDQYYSTGIIYIRATQSLASQPQAVGRHDILLNLRGREDRNMTGEAAFPGQEDGVVRSSNGDGKAVETNAQVLAKDAREGFKTDTESCGNAGEQKESWGFTTIDVDKQEEEEDDNVKELSADSCVLGRRDTKNSGSGNAEDCMRSGFNHCTQSDDVQRKLADPGCEHQKHHPQINREGSRQHAGDLVTENTRQQAISAASESHNHCCCSMEMTLESRSGRQMRGDKTSRTVDHVTRDSPALAEYQIQKRNAGDRRSGITANAPPWLRVVNETCRGCHRRGGAGNGQSERRIADLAKYENPNHNPADSSGEMIAHATVRVKKPEGTSSGKTNRLDSRPVEMCTADTSDLAEYYCCNPGGCDCCEITSLRQRKLHGEVDNVRNGYFCASNRGDLYDSLTTDFVSVLGNSQFEACASVQQLAQGERLGAGSCGNRFSECAKACEKHPSLALDSLTGKTECTPMPKDFICSHNNDSVAQSQGLDKKAGRTEQGALLSGFHTSQAGEHGSDSNTAPISDNTVPLQFDKPAAAARPDLSVSVTKATFVAQESSEVVGGHYPFLSTTGEISNHDGESPSIEQAGDEEEFGLFEKAGDRLHWDEEFLEFEQGSCWKKGCADVAVSPQSTSLDGWTAFSEEDTSGFGPGDGTEQDRDSGGQWWLDSAVEDTGTTPCTPLNLSRVFQDCFPSVTSSHWETDEVPSLREQMQRPASSLWEGLQDVNEAIGLKYKWAGSGAQKLLLHSLHIDVDTVACPQLSRASPDHRLNLFKQRNPADRISKKKISYDPNKNMLA
ncbi:uncharacterized protein si:ch211-14c7.2 [Polyodon spathula]|uniref:uncharacterized protein si:ch211-14c7.2 n=1 Tax=Polyodon spathula TaxID=7913 RepID=UPI001B7E2278|nr:uncharacterized protein si:ch211-14c7.2 [Polyodon spathula]